MKTEGFLSLILHSHLPFVRHPEDDSALEEDWLYEAITETYIPLIDIFTKLVNNNVHFKLTLSLSPTLISMLTDELLQDRYLNYINKLIELSEKELKRTAGQTDFYQVAEMYNKNFIKCKEIFIQYDCNLIKAFKQFQDIGVLEVITCTATHGYLPLMNIYPEAVNAQLEAGIQVYEEHFNTKPKGLWLPECGYYPKLDQILWDKEIRYFFVDTHGILNANPKPHYANFAPIYCPSGVAAFGRDSETSRQVWSSIQGYPGDYDYREFYRDIGFDLDYEYIKGYIHPEGFRKNTGIKYYRITNKDTNNKDVYKPIWAKQKAVIHAKDFLEKRQEQINNLSSGMDRPPILTSPYDTELFGHWWYEGPLWLEALISKIYHDTKNNIKLITPSEYLDSFPINQVATPSLSSWGDSGYSQVWLDESNDWIYPKLHKATEQMITVAKYFRAPNKLQKRFLNQSARELLLAQSSDWAFIIKNNTMKDYAIRRTNEHLENFDNLIDQLLKGSYNNQYLKKLETKHNLFPNLDYKIYQGLDNLNYEEVNI
ncbi:1,4-alpha-glucan branching enzyme [Orenia metallireducens]|jgi:1,4-alpha-glucan branching enzyme|uniref:1,4-alpha-glucan branching enzyme n=1 Tax=Orenia metallireducens TaxID=1413210 RepID=A0A285H5H0_9FIRM|nr:1,4-alpha-glucan branching protein domain-containing protein [Orenia metallireducens]PRX28637.1 1,4-alpha-glucan branching enzyme [Orenia metallireducens]SNY30955.1 1,4-alpha-glucan branching enzyme [Orenia metallireducens]